MLLQEVRKDVYRRKVGVQDGEIQDRLIFAKKFVGMKDASENQIRPQNILSEVQKNTYLGDTMVG